MTRQARKARLEAWQDGQRYAAEHDPGDLTMGTREEQIEYYRGMGQYFTAKAHDLTQQAQQETT